MLAVISDRIWTRIFQRDRGVLGRTLVSANQPFTVIGVMPPHMFSPRTVELWFPLMRRTDNPGWQMRDNHPGLIGWGLMKEGVTIEQAEREMSAVAARLAQTYPDSNTKIGVNVQLFKENQVGDYRKSLMILLAAVALVLLIACANLANLLAARGGARAREFAIRAAVGATRWQIVRQLLIESLILALIGALGGLCFAAWGRDVLVALSPPGVPRFQDQRIDSWVLLFTALLAVVTSVVFGLWPAWHTSRANMHLALKAGSHGSSDAPAARRSRDILIVIEVALTLILLSSAGLVLKSFANARAVALGYDPRDLFTARVDLPNPSYQEDEKIIRFTDELTRRMREIPGVEQASIASNPPLMTGWQTTFLPEGMPEPPPGQLPSAEMTVVMTDYYSTMKVPVLRGRAFNERDTKEAPPVVIVSQAMADKYYPGQDPVGKRLRMVTDEKAGRIYRTIIGVVPQLKVYGFEEPGSVLPQAYLPQTQVPSNGLVLLLRGTGSAGSLENALRKIVAEIDPAQPVFEFRTMQQRVEETWAAPRLMSFLLTAFAGLALVLAVVGLYGVMAYNGVRRTREIGVRLALGARRRQIAAMMVSQGMRLLGVGLLIGFGGAFALSRTLQSLLFGVGPGDLTIYFFVSVVLSLAAVLACWIPARRASRVDPMITLRVE